MALFEDNTFENRLGHHNIHHESLQIIRTSVWPAVPCLQPGPTSTASRHSRAEIVELLLGTYQIPIPKFCRTLASLREVRVVARSIFLILLHFCNKRDGHDDE
eukprot:scaffold1305_cov72-Skeletonema_dohrnii-CCMP3373.AAC.2